MDGRTIRGARSVLAVMAVLAAACGCGASGRGRPGPRSDAGSESGGGSVDAVDADGGGTCTRDEDCGTGRICLPEAGVCVPLGGTGGDCMTDEVRACGSDTGECSPGVERCAFGRWSGTCEGGVRPAAETCDGLDNDCNGTTDDEPRAGASCDDALHCSGVEACTGGRCVAGPPPSCDDGNPCTADACDETARACVQTPVADGTGCADGRFCNGAEICRAGLCTSGTPPACPDAPPCQVGYCDVASDGCALAPAPDGTSCADGTVCNGTETCGVGVCRAGTTLGCDDVNPCTADSCDAAAGCGHSAEPEGSHATECGALLGRTAACFGARCRGTGCTTDGECGDGIACTDDVCDRSGATWYCRNTPVASRCDDGSFCNGAETCDAGAAPGSGCRAGAPPACDDRNPCTSDACNEASDGCDNVPLAASMPCDDGQYCTQNDLCGVSGTCAGAPRSCDDGDACTADACNAVVGRCDHVPSPAGAACDDGKHCTVGDTCTAAGACGGAVRPCDDGNACTVDTCDEATRACASVVGKDADRDGHIDAACGGDDCDDADPGRHPGAPEICDNKDQDCDARADITAAGAGACDLGDPCASTQQCIGPLYCQPSASAAESRCTRWCNDSSEVSLDRASHACPPSYSCLMYSNTDSAGFCWPGGGTRTTGEACTQDADCRSRLCRLAGGSMRCVDGCSSTFDCTMSSSSAGWSCVVTSFTAPGGGFSHGMCGPAPGAGRTGDSCGAGCRDGLCLGPGANARCHDLCCSNTDCPAGTLCRWLALQDASSVKACTAGATGSRNHGEACTQDADCRGGQCLIRVADGSRYCSSTCCRDVDCPSGWRCDFGVRFPDNPGTVNDGVVRACVSP